MRSPTLIASLEGEVTRVEAGVDEPMLVLAWPMGRGREDARLGRTTADLIGWQLRDRGLPAGCDISVLRDQNVILCSMPPEDEDPGERAQRAQRFVSRMVDQALDARDGLMQRWRQLGAEMQQVRTWGDEVARVRVGTNPVGFLAEAGIAFHWHGTWEVDQPHDVVEALRLFRAEAGSARTILVEPQEATEVSGALVHGARGVHREHDLEEVGTALSEDALREMVVDPPLEELWGGRLQDGSMTWIVPLPGIAYRQAGYVYPVDPAAPASLRMAAYALIPDPESGWSVEAELDTTDRHWTYLVSSRDAMASMVVSSSIIPPPWKLRSRKAVLQTYADMVSWRLEALQDPFWRGSSPAGSASPRACPIRCSTRTASLPCARCAGAMRVASSSPTSTSTAPRSSRSSATRTRSRSRCSSPTSPAAWPGAR